MRFTRTVVLRALLGGDLGPFAAKIDQAWMVINEHIGEQLLVARASPSGFDARRRRRFEAARACSGRRSST